MNVGIETPYQCTNVSTFSALFCYVRMGSQRNDFQIIFKHVLFIRNSAFSSYLVLFQCTLYGVNFCQPLGTLLLSTLVLILYQAQVSFLSQDNIDACVNQIRIDFVRLCTDFDFPNLGTFVVSIDPVESSVSSCDFRARGTLISGSINLFILLPSLLIEFVLCRAPC